MAAHGAHLLTAATWIALREVDKNTMWKVYTRPERAEMLGRLRTAREAAEGALVQAAAQVEVVVEVEGTSPLI